jgi:ferredoxin
MGDNGSSDNKPRGEVQVESLLCKSCGLCAEYCPEELMKPATDIPPDDLDVPVMNPSGHVVYLIHDPEGQCNGCGICASACPEGAVVVYRRKPQRKSKPKAEAVSSGKEDADE